MFNDFEDIFEESYNYGYGVSDAELNKFGIIECAEDPDVACYRIALENEQNHNALMNTIMMQEMEYLEANGRELMWEAGAIRRIADRVKETIQRWWAKIKGVFKKLLNKIDSFTMSNKAFVRKYRTAKLTFKDVKFTGYQFNSDLGNAIKYSEVASYIGGEALDAAKRFKNKKNNTSDDADIELSGKIALTAYQNIIRGKLIGEGNASIAAESFASKLKSLLYGDTNTKEMKVSQATEGATTWDALMNQLENASLDKKAAKDAYKEAEDSVRAYLRYTNEKGKDAADDYESEIKIFSKLVNSSLNIMSSALSAQTAAIMARAQQTRRIANHILRAQKKAVGGYSNESFEYDIEGVELV